MKLTRLCELKLQYSWTEYVDLGAGGHYIGVMDGSFQGDRLRGRVRLVNAPPKRPDNVNCPRLSGVLTTHDGAGIYVELRGIALLRESDNARLFTTSLLMQSKAPLYRWVNTAFGLVEGVLNTVTDAAEGTVFLCERE